MNNTETFRKHSSEPTSEGYRIMQISSMKSGYLVFSAGQHMAYVNLQLPKHFHRPILKTKQLLSSTKNCEVELTGFVNISDTVSRTIVLAPCLTVISGVFFIVQTYMNCKTQNTSFLVELSVNFPKRNEIEKFSWS